MSVMLPLDQPGEVGIDVVSGPARSCFSGPLLHVDKSPIVRTQLTEAGRMSS